jgi:hypothetical protein
MTAKTKTNARLTRELLETAKDMHASGIMNDAAYEKITLRHLKRAATAPTAPPMTGDPRLSIRLPEQLRQPRLVRREHLRLPDGRLASGSNDGTIRLWNVSTGAETARLEASSRASPPGGLRRMKLAAALVGSQAPARDYLGQPRSPRARSILSRSTRRARRAISTIDQNTRAAIAVIPSMTKTPSFIFGRSSFGPVASSK